MGTLGSVRLIVILGIVLEEQPEGYFFPRGFVERGNFSRT